ncbi:MAG: DUF5615 family PIN-like protein [Verrucomicrobiales bacterium]|jgi:predicted nuclease of predicted toxin-antitoxin system|nr:DUF5615 family PIN-like protein [Verrucomicrobiales bacterium]
MNLIVDMNLSPKWVPFLRRHGINAVHWLDIGESGAPDEKIFTYAAGHDMIVMTNDLDFGSILFYSRECKPSVVQLRMADLLPVSAGLLVVAALQQFAPDLAQGSLITVLGNKTRVRKLPL